MSEYQYYEFRTIDRPLGPDEMAQLRAVSTRAEITPSSFVNHYEWGDLKADPSDWMRRYFDAFVYSANWCSCRLSLRVPLATLSEDEVASFGDADGLRITASDTHWIIDWCLNESENYDRFGMDDGSGWIRRLMPLRDELLCGDLRALYLGWLATTAGGQALDLPVGRIEPGFAMDAIAVNCLAPDSNIWLWPGEDSSADVLQKIIYHATRANVERTWVQGVQVHGRLPA